MTEKVLRYCIFCAKNQNEVEFFVAAPKAIHICNECVELCSDIIAAAKAKKLAKAIGKND